MRRRTATWAASFWPKKARSGFGGDEQLGDDGGDAAKVAGTRCAVEAIAEVFDFDEGGCACGVEFFDGRGKDYICAFGWARAQSASKVRG